MTDQIADGLTVAEAAAYLKLHRSTISRLVSSGRIPHRMVGRAPRFSRQALSRWLAGHDDETPTTLLVTAPTAALTGIAPRQTPKHVGRRRATGLADGSGGASLGVVRGGRG